MNTIHQNADNVINYLMKNSLIDNLSHNTNINDYVKLTDKLLSTKHAIGKALFLSYINKIESEFKNRKNRSSRYYNKGVKSRTILTRFGEITFNRTYYQDRSNGKCFFYLDNQLQLEKYQYLDPYLSAILVSEMGRVSISESTRIINRLVSSDDTKPISYISRQLARNILHRTNFDYEIPCSTTPDTLTILADEKWINLQRESKSMAMCKCAVIYESSQMVSKNRNKLNNKTVVMSTNNFSQRLLDVLHSKYNLDEVKQINIVGDGATWIKNLKKDIQTNGITINSYLDKFHFNKTINQITKDKALRRLLVHYIKSNEKFLFVETLNVMIEKTPSRAETLTQYRNYIVNNFANIHNTYKLNIPCCMESQISHNLASHFARAPKGYTTSTLKKLIKLREGYVNKNSNIRTILTNKRDSTTNFKYDFSMFEKPEETYSVANGNFKIN